MTFDDLIKRPLHIEHHREELALTGLAGDPGNKARGVIENGQSHRLRKAFGGIDGEYAHLATHLGSTQGQCRRRRGLADASGSCADDDVDTLVSQQIVDTQLRGAVEGGHAMRPSTRSCASA